MKSGTVFLVIYPWNNSMPILHKNAMKILKKATKNKIYIYWLLYKGNVFAESLEVAHETPEIRETQTEYRWNSGFKALRVTTRLIMETFLNFLRGSLRSFALNRILPENLKIVQLVSKWTAFGWNNTCQEDGSWFEPRHLDWDCLWFTSVTPGQFGTSPWLWGEHFRP